MLTSLPSTSAQGRSLWESHFGPVRRTGKGRHGVPPGGAPLSPVPTLSRDPRRGKSSVAGERSWEKKRPQAPAAGTPSSWQPLAEQLGLQLGLITLTSSRACCGGAPSTQLPLPADVTPFLLPARLGLRGVGCTQRGRAPPACLPAGLPWPFFLCQAHSGQPRALALLPGIVREASNTPKSIPGTLPIPFNVEPSLSWFLCVQRVW